MYERLTFPRRVDRPWFYTNFSVTIDGKAALNRDDVCEWPGGSETDFDTLLTLRAQADVLVHGRKTAQVYRALNRLESSMFQARRRSFGKDPYLPYVIVSRAPQAELVSCLASSQPIPTYVATLGSTTVPEPLRAATQTLFFGERAFDIGAFVHWCKVQNFERVLIEGGPELLQAFMNARLIDEIFLTVVPKIFGGIPGVTKTLLDHGLMSSKDFPEARLISCIPMDDELFLRYRLNSL